MQKDLDLETVDSAVINDDYYNYAYRTQYRGEVFWIVYDKYSFKDYLGFDSTKEFEDFLDEIFNYNWGYEDSWQACYNCGNAIYIGDYYSQDYWTDYDGGGVYCGDCVKNVEEVRNAYLDHLINNKDACNLILSEEQLEEAGLEKLEEYEYDYHDRRSNPQTILDELLYKYPNGKFIFDLRTQSSYNIVYTVWAFPGYKEGAKD